MRNSVKALIKKGRSEALAIQESMHNSRNSAKTRLQNEARFQAQYNQTKGKCIQAQYNPESGLYEER